MSDTRFASLLDNHPELQLLNRELRQLAMLQNAVAEALPAPLATSVSVASVKDGELMLFADNGPVAAKLKQIAPRMLILLRQRGYEITGIHLQVQVRIRDNPLPQKQFSLGPGARSALDALSDRLETSPLKAALKRLRRHGT